MQTDEHYSEIKAALVEQLGIPGERITPSATLVGDLEMDSLDRVEFVAVLEGRLGRSIDSEEIEGVVTVQDVVAVVRRLVGRADDEPIGGSARPAATS